MYEYPQINVDSIQSAIVKGMRCGYNKCLMYLGETEEGLSSIQEYILTISVADSLSESLIFTNQVRVEHPYQEFSDEAFPPSGFRNNNPFDCIYRKQVFDKPDKRKIDIALLSTNGGRSLCGIEIKAINQSYNKIRNDIERLSEALQRRDDVSESSLQVCFVTFIKRMDKRFKYVSNADVEAYKEKSQKKIIQKLISTMQPIFPDLAYSLDSFTIDVSTAEKEFEHVFDDGEDFSHRTRAIFGYIIKILPDKINKEKNHV